MATELNLHDAQAKILRTLLFNPTAKFSQLNCDGLSNDHFTFHLNQLVRLGMVKKLQKGQYELTPQGKEFANRMDTDTVKIERQAKVAALVIGISRGKILMQKRLKQPYFGFWGFVSGKVRWGETGEEAAKRELLEETGLEAVIIVPVGIEHKIDQTEKEEMLEDKVFLIFKVTKTSGELKTKHEGGENHWLTRPEIEKLPDLFPDVLDLIKMATGNKLKLVEKRFIVNKY